MVGTADGRVVECSNVVATRARVRAITIPHASARPADDAAPRVIHSHRNTAVQKNAIKNTTSNKGLARSANTAVRNTDRPQRAGAGVAEWG
jgi:hypothetical protein